VLSALLIPQLLNCRRLFLRNYEVQIHIGVYEWEKKSEQRLMVNVDLYIPLTLSTPIHDELEEVVDYDFMRNTIAKRMADGHIHLQETLCDDLAAALLEHPSVCAARVSSMKTDVYLDCDGVGVEVLRIKSIGN
jgi:dihydroneopterin aldolase